MALRNSSESPILSSSATVHPPSVDWSLPKEPHGGRLRQRPIPIYTLTRTLPRNAGPQGTQNEPNGSIWPLYTGQIDARSVTRPPFRTVSRDCLETLRTSEAPHH